MPMTPASRRRFLHLAGLAAAGALTGACRPWTRQPLPVAGPTPTLRSPGPVEADDALERLRQGNARYAAGRMLTPGHTTERRMQIAEGQHPFAAVLACADSRVPPEILFDQGLGDLFVARVAGNVADDEITGSLEYAVEHLGVRLIVVLGHTRCGAIRAALEAVLGGAEAEGHLESLVHALEPAIEEADLTAGNVWDVVCDANVHHTAAQLRAARPFLHEFVEHGELRIVGARYDLETSWITFLPDEAESEEAHG